MLAQTLSRATRTALTLSAPALKAWLTAVDLYDPNMPSSYAEGAETPVDLPPPANDTPPASPTDALADALDGATEEALQATPDGFEPGLMEDLIGLTLTMDNVEEVLDELVRPALNADGGDIRLIKIEDNDIHVKLVGACSTCPSSTMTMRMGVERLLQEEFPDMGELVDVGAAY